MESTEKHFTWAVFNALPFDLRDGAERFWEDGYDYDDPDFWAFYEDASPAFVAAVQMYDWLRHHIPEQ